MLEIKLLCACMLKTPHFGPKRALRKLLNEESRKIVEGTLETPYTDSLLKKLLRGHFDIITTRHNITAIRRDLGIPAAHGRSQNFWHVPASAFSGVHPLTARDISLKVPQSCGVYELRLRDGEIAYPGGRSSIFYIGRSKNPTQGRLRSKIRDGSSRSSRAALCWTKYNGHPNSFPISRELWIARTESDNSF